LKGYVIATKGWACRYDGTGKRLMTYREYDEDVRNFKKNKI
jgi:hypothetical protein